jgi:hypothetical protein
MEVPPCPISFSLESPQRLRPYRYGLIDRRESVAQEICFAAYLGLIKDLAAGGNKCSIS